MKALTSNDKLEIIDCITQDKPLPVRFLPLLFPDNLPVEDWETLNTQQKGRYAEYYAKMVFTANGYEVYTSEVDDRGVDFVCKKDDSIFYQVQVKSVFKSKYVLIKKSKMPLADDRIVCLLIFEENTLPSIYIIPSKAWENTNSTFLVDRDYDKEGQKCAPEWGINISNKHADELNKYLACNFFNNKN